MHLNLVFFLQGRGGGGKERREENYRKTLKQDWNYEQTQPTSDVTISDQTCTTTWGGKRSHFHTIFYFQQLHGRDSICEI